MEFLRTLARVRRGEINFLLLAALVAVLVLPCGGQAVAMPRESYEAVLIWLRSETALSTPLVQRTRSLVASLTWHEQGIQLPAVHLVQAHGPAAALTREHGYAATHLTVAMPAHSVPCAANTLTLPAVAHLNGVRTNRRLI